ncbi:MAG: IscS subfamily cysteine desulfurase [Acidobacteria bacterium]|nr:IscS subfamily cysteine desulfurase [Acidobacteriota bacterium]
MKLPIYMDHHATTPVDPRVVEAMLPYFSEHFGNPASRNHAFGWRAEQAVETARAQVADLLGARSREIVFTSGATESINTALKGVAAARRPKGNHIIALQTEHKAVLDSLQRLEQGDYRVSYIPVEPDGLVAVDRIARAISGDTILISILHANNEIGVIQPVTEIGALARQHGVTMHVDAAQAAGKIPIDVEADRIDLLSLTAHKLYGPKGVGALYIRRRDPRVEMTPLIDGGGHERGFRSGTLNVPGIVGLGKACEIASAEMATESMRLCALRDRLLDGLRKATDDIAVNGSLELRLPHNLNVSFAGVDGETLLMGLDDIAVSSGSACTTATPQPSHVLRALGIGDSLAQASLRFGLGRWNTEEEVDYAVEKVSRIVKRLRELSPIQH